MGEYRNKDVIARITPLLAGVALMALSAHAIAQDDIQTPPDSAEMTAQSDVLPESPYAVRARQMKQVGEEPITRRPMRFSSGGALPGLPRFDSVGSLGPVQEEGTTTPQVTKTPEVIQRPPSFTAKKPEPEAPQEPKVEIEAAIPVQEALHSDKPPQPSKEKATIEKITAKKPLPSLRTEIDTPSETVPKQAPADNAELAIKHEVIMQGARQAKLEAELPAHTTAEVEPLEPLKPKERVETPETLADTTPIVPENTKKALSTPPVFELKQPPLAKTFAPVIAAKEPVRSETKKTIPTRKEAMEASPQPPQKFAPKSMLDGVFSLFDGGKENATPASQEQAQNEKQETPLTAATSSEPSVRASHVSPNEKKAAIDTNAEVEAPAEAATLSEEISIATPKNKTERPVRNTQTMDSVLIERDSSKDALTEPRGMRQLVEPPKVRLLKKKDQQSLIRPLPAQNELVASRGDTRKSQTLAAYRVNRLNLSAGWHSAGLKPITPNNQPGVQLAQAGGNVPMSMLAAALQEPDSKTRKTKAASIHQPPEFQNALAALTQELEAETSSNAAETAAKAAPIRKLLQEPKALVIPPPSDGGVKTILRLRQHSASEKPAAETEPSAYDEALKTLSSSQTRKPETQPSTEQDSLSLPITVSERVLIQPVEVKPLNAQYAATSPLQTLLKEQDSSATEKQTQSFDTAQMSSEFPPHAPSPLVTNTPSPPAEGETAAEAVQIQPMSVRRVSTINPIQGRVEDILANATREFSVAQSAGDASEEDRAVNIAQVEISPTEATPPKPRSAIMVQELPEIKPGSVATAVQQKKQVILDEDVSPIQTPQEPVSVAAVEEDEPDEPQIVQAPKQPVSQMRIEVQGEPPTKLTADSETMLKKLPGGINAPKIAEAAEEVSIARATARNLELQQDTVRSHEALGISIEVKQPDINVHDYLVMAYEAFRQNQPQLAQSYYQQILEEDPHNIDAKLGMATISHQAKEYRTARRYYIEVLTQNPKNMEALNNFLVLVSEESPGQAIAELTELFLKNPDYDALPAQIATLYANQGQLREAIAYMAKAVEVNPLNLRHRYNLAVMLDHAGQTEQAIQAYHSVQEGIEKGGDLEVDLSNLQERLTFLLSNASG